MNSVGIMLRALGRLRLAQAAIHRVMGHVAGWVFVFCAFFIAGDVIGRNFFGVSSQSSVELTGYMLALGTTWALGHTLVERCHVRIDIIIQRLPPNARYGLHIVSLALLVVFVGFIAKGAIDLVAESWLFQATDISLLRVPLVIPQGLWAIGFGMFFLLATTMLVECIVLFGVGRGRDVERMLHARSYDEEAAEAIAAAGVDSSDAAQPRP